METVIVMAVTLAIFVLGVIYFAARKSGSKKDVVSVKYAGAEEPEITRKSAKRSPRAVLVFKLDRHGSVTGKLAHAGTLLGAPRDNVVVVRKENGAIVRRSARRVQVVAFN